MADPGYEVVCNSGRISGLGPPGDVFVVLQFVDKHRHGPTEDTVD